MALAPRLRRAVHAFLDDAHENASPPRRPRRHGQELADISQLDPLIPLTDVPAATEPAEFLGAEVFDELVPGFVFLNWRTQVGVLTAAYPTTDDGPRGHPNHVRHLKTDTRVLFSVAELGFHSPDGPDVSDYSNPPRTVRHQVLWRYYARAIGRPAPYWPWNLNHRQLIERWHPEAPLVTAVPTQQLDMTPLLQMAALYPEDATVARVLRHLYCVSAYAASEGSRLAFRSMAEEREGDPAWTLSGRLHLAAAAVDMEAPPAGHLDKDFGETALRSAFAEISRRRDTLAEQVVDRIYCVGADRWFPFNRTERYGSRRAPDGSPAFQEWRDQLDEVPLDAPDARFGGLLREDAAQRFLDPATDAPVVKIDHWGGPEYVTVLPRRLPSTSPLSELVLDGGDAVEGQPTQGDHAWVRTEDGTLYPLPAGDSGYAWGYSGTGPGVLAALVDRLLDDITAAPADQLSGVAPGLERLFEREWPNGTVFTRAELEQARRRK